MLQWAITHRRRPANPATARLTRQIAGPELGL